MDRDSFLAELRARAKSSSISSGSEIGKVQVISAGEGCSVLDHYVLGCGGFPIGRMVELAAEEGAGKTSLGINFLASAQLADANAVYVDAERRINIDRMIALGVDETSLVVTKPKHVEDMLEFLEGAFPVFVKSGRPTALVIDSIASLPTKEEYDHGVAPGEDKEAVAGRARLLSRAIRVLAERIEVANVALLVINQLRTKIGGNSFRGADTFTPGGKALAYYAAVRLAMTPGEKIESRGVRVGKSPLVYTQKNLYAAPRSARLCLRYDSGFDDVRSLCILGKDIGIIAEAAQPVRSNADEVLRVMNLAHWDPVRAAEIIEGERGAKPTKKKVKKK